VPREKHGDEGRFCPKNPLIDIKDQNGFCRSSSHDEYMRPKDRYAIARPAEPGLPEDGRGSLRALIRSADEISALGTRSTNIQPPPELLGIRGWLPAAVLSATRNLARNYRPSSRCARNSGDGQDRAPTRPSCSTAPVPVTERFFRQCI